METKEEFKQDLEDAIKAAYHVPTSAEMVAKFKQEVDEVIASCEEVEQWWEENYNN